MFETEVLVHRSTPSDSRWNFTNVGKLMDRTEEREQTVLFLLKNLEGRTISKSCLSSLIYLTQTYGVDLGYCFDMCDNGVVCDMLHSTIDVMDQAGLIDIEDVGGEEGHNIWIGEYAAFGLHKFFAGFEHEFTHLFSVFGDCSARLLQLYVAMLFTIEWLREHDDNVLTAVKKVAFLTLFNDEELEAAYKYLLTVNFGDR